MLKFEHVFMDTSPSYNEIDVNQANDIPFSYFRKTVSLREWWLVKADNDYEGKRLAVAGFTCGEGRAFRVFKSAPITKRRDTFTLEAADGIIVVLQGFINEDRTIENGFPSEVFSHFLFDFPRNWEIYAEKYTAGMDSTNTSCLEKPTNNSENQIEEYRDGLKSRTANTLMEAQSPQTSLGCIDDEVEVPNELISNYQDLEQNPNQVEDIVMPSAKQTDDITPSKVKPKRSSNARLSNPSNRTCKNIVEDSMNNQNPKNVAESPMKHKNKRKKGLGKCSHSTLNADSDIQQKMLKASEALRNSSNSLKSKESTEHVLVKGGSSTRKSKRRIIFDKLVESPRTQESKEKMHIVSPESFRRSRSGRLLLPTLEFWRNQFPIYDADRNITGIQEELSSSAGSKSKPRKKHKKRH